MNDAANTDHAVKCIHCSSPRVAHTRGKVSGAFWMSMGGREYSGYVPSNIGLGDDNDYIDFDLCLDCVRLQKTSAIRYIAKLDVPRRHGVKTPRRVPGQALPELQSLPSNWPGQCACGAAFEEGAAIDYSLTIKKVVGCPVCNATRAPQKAVILDRAARSLRCELPGLLEAGETVAVTVQASGQIRVEASGALIGDEEDRDVALRGALRAIIEAALAGSL